MTEKVLLFLLLSFLLTRNIQAQNATMWRGDGSGVYHETGLLKEWPANGPEILWSYEGIGEGHSSPVVAGNTIYLSGMVDSIGYVFALSQDGKLKWKAPYGEEFIASYPGARSSVVVDGDLLYMYSGFGELVCMDTADGARKWSKNVLKEFGGENITWGVTETVLIDGDLLYVTPGGKTNNIVALDRFDGKLVWSSPGKGETSAYCTPLLVELPARKLLVTHTADHLIGLDAKTGDLLWNYPHTNRWKVHANTPVYSDGGLFCFSGYGQGGEKLNLSADGSSVTEAWTKKELDSRIGGMVFLDGYLYGSGDNAREWRCVNWETGEETYVAKDIAKGVVIADDGMLYCYSERGELALVKADPKEFKIISQTKVELGSSQHWAHPVINDGRLLLRHGNTLIAYKIK